LSVFTKAHPRLAPNLKDAITNFAILGVIYTKDSLPEAARLELESDYRVLAGNIVQAVRDVNREQARMLFGGNHLDILDKLIRHGASLRTYVSQNDIEKSFYHTMMAATIPIAWNTDSKHKTFIL